MDKAFLCALNVGRSMTPNSFISILLMLILAAWMLGLAGPEELALHRNGSSCFTREAGGGARPPWLFKPCGALLRRELLGLLA
jgi:hypothetical protein